MPFKRRVIKNYIEIGAITRSSKFLYKKMTHDIDFSKDLHIVEYGPGDGIFTDGLLKEISKKSHITIFEIDEGFCKFLKEKYKNEPRVTIIDKSACHIKDFFEKNSIDYILSSLPLAFIDKNIVCEILSKSKFILKPEGKFIQYQYFLQNKKQIQQYFPKMKYKFTLLNLPPAFIYVCQK